MKFRLTSWSVRSEFFLSCSFSYTYSTFTMTSMRRLTQEVELELYPSGYGVSDSDGDASDTLEDEISAWEDKVSGGQGILADSKPPLKSRRTEEGRRKNQEPKLRSIVRVDRGSSYVPRYQDDRPVGRPHFCVGRGQGRGRGIARGYFRPNDMYNRLGWRQAQFSGPRAPQWEGRRGNFSRENDYRRDQLRPHVSHSHYQRTRRSPSVKEGRREDSPTIRRDSSRGKREASGSPTLEGRASRPRQSRREREGRATNPGERTPPLKASTPIPREEAHPVEKSQPAETPSAQEPVVRSEPNTAEPETVEAKSPKFPEGETDPKGEAPSCLVGKAQDKDQACQDEQLRLALEGLKEVAESMSTPPPQEGDILPLSGWDTNLAEVGEVLSITTAGPPQENSALMTTYPEAPAVEHLGQVVSDPVMEWRQPPISPGTSVASKSPPEIESVEGMGVLISCQKCDGVQNVPATSFLDPLRPRAMTCRKCGGLILIKFSNQELWEIMN